jgi:peroxiredoxin 5
MPNMFAARRVPHLIRPRRGLWSAKFHSSRPAFVKAGDSIPDLEVLVENSPGNKVNLAKTLKGKGIIIGVPAAFSKGSHHYLVLVGQRRSSC